MALWRPGGQTQTAKRGKVSFTEKRRLAEKSEVKADPSKTYRDVDRKKQFCECNGVNFPPILNVVRKERKGSFRQRDP